MLLSMYIPPYPIISVVNPFSAKLCAWYIILGLRPMSPSTRIATERSECSLRCRVLHILYENQVKNSRKAACRTRTRTFSGIESDMSEDNCKHLHERCCPSNFEASERNESGRSSSHNHVLNGSFRRKKCTQAV